MKLSACVLRAGETCAVEATPSRPVLGSDALSARAGPSSDELVSAVWWPPPRFALIGTAGVMELEKRRPVELLMVGRGGRGDGTSPGLGRGHVLWRRSGSIMTSGREGGS
jgi:hypothetical protein